MHQTQVLLRMGKGLLLLNQFQVFQILQFEFDLQNGFFYLIFHQILLGAMFLRVRPKLTDKK